MIYVVAYETIFRMIDKLLELYGDLQLRGPQF